VEFGYHHASFRSADDPERSAIDSALSCPYSGVTLYDDAGDVEYIALAEGLDEALRESGIVHEASPDPAETDRDGKLRRVFETGEESVDEPVTFERYDATFEIPTALLLPIGDHGPGGGVRPRDHDRRERDHRLRPLLREGDGRRVRRHRPLRGKRPPRDSRCPDAPVIVTAGVRVETRRSSP
jgi:hypothetical protein